MKYEIDDFETNEKYFYVYDEEWQAIKSHILSTSTQEFIDEIYETELKEIGKIDEKSMFDPYHWSNSLSIQKIEEK